MTHSDARELVVRQIADVLRDRSTYGAHATDLAGEVYDRFVTERGPPTARDAECERPRATISQIKQRVCGDRRPENNLENTAARGHIADLCDAALSHGEEGKTC